ncbi:2-hydroxyacid dehydrogenase [Leucobacter sp. UT-8R-CII-1-4]|uniref:2-hydroxyacid dehydrogenase n=1 Tax=Leucobacter sp. UT-8R-CII-1-4 TaxID=3040075 RepID=UPI0024A9F4BC|nr:2-hydroxyacid dehydrogenase [Leucobacter sp. UT-8R-CII-1-4]MDI6023551.1 2-hydroxyacid dehydrogenase [Leucobacter sp. UT-8R-CII-1-4]
MRELVVSLPSDSGLKEAVGDLEGVEFVLWDLDGPAPRPVIDLVVPPYWGGNDRLARVREVSTQLVQWQSIGYNGIAEVLPAGVPLANASTVHESGTAELALGLMIAGQRGMGSFIREGLSGTWNLRTFPSLADRRVLIVGYGGVAKAVEARLAGFEVQISRIARSARTEQNHAGETVEVLGFDRLHDALRSAEVVVLTVPLTAETAGMMNAEALAAMPDDALLVNVARGAVVDTEALTAELRAGRLRAALDVTEPEPLPADHPLWGFDNVIITPHAGGDSTAMMPRIGALIRRQIAHLQAGETPENIVLGASTS